MSTMNVLDAAGSTVAVEKPLVPGQALMAASRPVVIASDQSAVPVSGTVAVSGSVAVTGTFWQSTQPVSPIAPASTSRLLSAAASTNATSVKASAGTLKAIQGYNAKTSPVYLKLYNKASAPTVGTDTPVKTLYLPASSAFALDFAYSFSTGIAYALTGAAADNDTTALASGDIACLNVDYI